MEQLSMSSNDKLLTSEIRTLPKSYSIYHRLNPSSQKGVIDRVVYVYPEQLDDDCLVRAVLMLMDWDQSFCNNRHN